MAPEPADDPALAACKDKVKHFRLKELKDVLHQLGLPKQGKKQELVDRIVAVFSDQQDQASKMNGLPNKNMVGKETLVKIVEDTFSKMHEPANANAASKNQIESGQSVKPKKKSSDSAQLDVKVRCPCGNSMANGAMIKCDDPQCNIWQHVNCVISKKPGDGVPPELPTRFYCEMCRISRADPFWVTINSPLLPMSIAPCNIAADGSYTVQYLEKTFPLSRANREMLQKAETEIQVWCVLLDDAVPFRMHWPLHSDMRVNGDHVRVVNRQATQQLGANGRDDGQVLTQYMEDGANKIVLARSDSRTFCLGVRIAKRRSLEEVLNLVPKEQDGEKFDDALARVRRCVGGGTEADNPDSDSDIEVVAVSVSVNLRCPMTGSRIKIAGRFKPCVHMGCFDLEAFVKLNQRSRKWQCPICLKNYSLEDIIIDPYFNRIASFIQSCGDDVSEIDVKPDGSWRVRGGAELKDLKQWHLPDGTLCMARGLGCKPNMATVKNEIKDEPLSEELGCRLKLGIRKNNNGMWEISKKGNANLTSSSDNDQKEHLESENCISLTSNSDNENAKDLESGQHDYPMNNVHDLDSSPMDERISPVAIEQDIIILSDSDDDGMLLSPSALNCGSAHDTGDPFPANPPETSGTCAEQQPGGGPDETSLFGLNDGFDDLGLSFWEYPSSDPSTQVADNLIELQDFPTNHQSLHQAVTEGSLDTVAPAARHDSLLQESLGLSCADGSLTNAKSASRKRMNTGAAVTALDASVLDDDLTGERSRGPSSPPRQSRSVRPRLILNIDSDSD